MTAAGSFEHVPVLADALLEAHPGLRLVGLDRDPGARAAAAATLERFGDRVRIEASNFADHASPPSRLWR